MFFPNGCEGDMIATAAVVAHFDPNDSVEPYFRLVLSCLEEVCDTIVLVTTSRLPDAEIPKGDNIITIQRPNIGYDFYSYRVGIEKVWHLGGAERIFLLNSSFLVLNKRKFIATLRGMLYKEVRYKVVGATESRQIVWHLQSYLMLLGGEVLQSVWFMDYVKSIQPQNSKFETILHYELGLSRLLVHNRVDAASLFKPGFLTALRAGYAWMGKVAASNNRRSILNTVSLRHMREINWTHFAASELARKLGFAKTELLTSNPHNIDINFLEAVTHKDLVGIVRNASENFSGHYAQDKDGLTCYVGKGNSCLPASRLVQAGSIGRPGVRVAVVVHLFYIDLLEEICSFLINILEPFDLYVTTPFEAAVPRIINRCTQLAQGVLVSLTENRGRDIGPFLALYRRGLLDGYDVVLKVHTKRSEYSANGKTWRQLIFRSLVGDSFTVQKTLNIFSKEHVGIVGPHKYYLTNSRFWGADEAAVGSLLRAIELLGQSESPALGFFAGSMFWFVPRALQPLKQIPENCLDFEPEEGKQDGTLAHALERVFCIVSRRQGYCTTSVELAGEEIDETATSGNDVPVL
jgi:rhamnosyltransferase